MVPGRTRPRAPALYDALLSRNIPAFLAIAKRFTELFPTVQSLRMVNSDEARKPLGLTLTDGTEVGPEAMSEGMLYWLAFAVIEHLSPVGMILIEEPENGLHLSRIAEVMRILREVSQRTQIPIATHSPLIINELAPEEVTIVTRRPETGTICTPMTQTKNFAERSKVSRARRAVAQLRRRRPRARARLRRPRARPRRGRPWSP